VFARGDPATTLFLLVEGAVELSAAPEGGGPATVVQTVTHPGHPVGWSALVAPYTYRATATAREPTRLLAIPRAALEGQATARPTFGVALMRAVIGVVGDRLRATRARPIARRYDDVVAAVRDLLEESGPRLSVAPRCTGSRTTWSTGSPSPTPSTPWRRWPPTATRPNASWPGSAPTC
jgi:CRP-like cAMP-binding protein